MKHGFYRFEQEVSNEAVPLWQLVMRDECPTPERVPLVIGDWIVHNDALTVSALLPHGVYRVHTPKRHIQYFVVDHAGDRHEISVGEVRAWLGRLKELGDMQSQGITSTIAHDIDLDLQS